MNDRIDPISESTVRAANDMAVVLGRLIRRMRDAKDTHELTPSQVSLLNRLGKVDAASASELAAAERIRPQSVAATLSVLEERALIVRRRDPADGRRHLVSLSDAGREIIENRRRGGEAWLVRELEERYDESERLALIEAMALLERLTRP